MNILPETTCAVQRNPRACESCRQSKSRCLPSSKDHTCQRCLKFDLKCAVRAVARPRRAKKAAIAGEKPVISTPRIGHEEDESSEVYIKLASLPVIETCATVAVLGEHHEEAFQRIFFPDEKQIVDDQFPNNVMHCDESAKIVTTAERVQRSLSLEEAGKLLEGYRAMASFFPFVVISENETVQSMSRNSPFLLMAILTSACHQDVQLHNGLDHEFRRILGSEIIAMGKKGLDFLQGMLVYTCWYPCHLNPRNRQSFMFINVAVSMAIELGLDKRQPNTSTLFYNDQINTRGLLEDQGFSRASKRAYLGCFYLSSAISLGFQKPNTLKYNELLDEYGVFLSTYPEIMTDFAILPLVRAHKLEEKIRDFVQVDLPQFDSSAVKVETQLQAELDEWRLSNIDEVKSMINVALGERFMEISLYSYDLALFRPSEASDCDRYLNPINLLKCLDACRSFFEYLLSIPVVKYTMFTHVQWGCIVQAIIVLSRLSFPIPNCPGWDSRAARERAPLVMYIEALCYRMQSLSSEPPGLAEIPKNPDGPYIFRMVLENIVKRYNQKLEGIEKEISYSSGRKVSGGSCPMRDPDLARYFQQDILSDVGQPGSSDNGSSTSGSAPVYFDLWRTMTMSWGDTIFE